MHNTLDNLYIEWLYKKFASVRNRNPATSYWELARFLYAKRFIWRVSNDDNRVADGIDLRYEFLDTVRRAPDPLEVQDWLELECSMLEMLVALCLRIANEAEGSQSQWFWQLMRNLEIDRYSDDIWEISIEEEVEEVVDRINNRTYSRDGHGGLFPLRRARRDQRKVELWFQKEAYLLEDDRFVTGPR